MIKYKIVIAVTAAVLLVGLLAGCTGISGVPAEQYESAAAQLRESQAKIAELQGEINDLNAQNKSIAAELATATGQIAGIQSQISGLKEQYELAGKTPAETAANIVRRYHETHTYSIQDFYVCSDMAADVWNMLETQGINAYFMIGSLDHAVAEITQCDHAWVLAEVGAGDYLALETTSGGVYRKSEKPAYYTGWSFQTPREYKRYQELSSEYNLRVGVINLLVAEINDVVEEYNDAVDEWNSKYAGSPFSIGAQVLDARMEEIQKKQELLTGIKREQESLAVQNLADAEALATPVNY